MPFDLLPHRNFLSPCDIKFHYHFVIQVHKYLKLKDEDASLELTVAGLGTLKFCSSLSVPGSPSSMKETMKIQCIHCQITKLRSIDLLPSEADQLTASQRVNLCSPASGQWVYLRGIHLGSGCPLLPQFPSA